MKLYTPFGETMDPSRERIEADIDALQRHADEDVFVGVERPDGSFLQMRRLPIEYGDGHGNVRRASLPPDVRRVFLAFAAGREDWDAGIEWIEDPAPRGLSRRVPGWVVVGAVVLVVAGIAGYYLLR